MMKLLAVLVMLLAFCALFVWTLGARGSGAYPLLYPQVLIGGVCLMLGVLALQQVRDVRRARMAGDVGGEDDGFAWQPVAALAASFVYVLSWTSIGHVPATAIFLFIALLIAGERRPVALLVFALGLTALIQLLFIQGLRIPLPRIPWL
ncbi:tripartite tricarboxylate transporter TctB family protein [Arsenicitalea aurantiaca]|uniref:Tripartite tricarboxylate transporter TctB family protein n=1 Tax=Arsenicitalea aurantiaca TaxID=1783274 RepID=A0A433X7M1_9HYPH|nr:tripartite tricarboxylate transporter TctB family protein [Arsenicitalea aurantiaca]RUT30087.1 tripartite tricarboxylate transporter TctB family protein [Arsenicitalea aurantiaca]